jgi:ADP-ribose pyrophosphatase YjhB (NUDIX family)
MLRKFISWLWKNTPRHFRLQIIRVSQTKFTVSVAAIITNDDEKVLVLDHLLRPHSSWGLPGGFINVGESPVTAIKREILEETGLELIDLELFRVRTLGRHLEILFVAKSIGTASVQSREINDFGWFSLDEMPDQMSFAQIEIVRTVLSNRK